jgi:ribosomal protein S18 acetylase RimI-like enzyme
MGIAMSLYAKYLTERTNDRILETGHGFIAYRILADQKSVYVTDIYVDTDFRNAGTASQLAEEVIKIAKKEGCTRILGAVIPSMKNSTDSLKFLVAYGMKVQSASNDFILMEKDI